MVYTLRAGKIAGIVYYTTAASPRSRGAAGIADVAGERGDRRALLRTFNSRDESWLTAHLDHDIAGTRTQTIWTRTYVGVPTR